MTCLARTLQSRTVRLVGVAMLHLVSGLLSVADLRAQAVSPTDQRDPTWTRPSGARFELFPDGDVYPVYVADPHRPTNAIQMGVYPEPEIPEALSPRAALSAGGRFGMLRIVSAQPGGRSFQVSIEAGLDAIFDSQHRNDAIGWDGNYGLAFTTASASRLAWKVAVLHVSAHLGDEYQDRTDTSRINYTRQEVALGASWRCSPRLRAYSEVGVAYSERSAQQEPWRLQLGLERESRPKLWSGRFATYAAADFSSMQERGWHLDTTIQGGIVTRSGGRTSRLYLELRDGRPSVGEFFRFSETVITFGFRIDL